MRSNNSLVKLGLSVSQLLATCFGFILKLCAGPTEVLVNLFLVSKIKGYGTVDFFKAQNRKGPANSIRRRAAVERCDDRIEGDARTSNPIATIALFYVNLLHTRKDSKRRRPKESKPVELYRILAQCHARQLNGTLTGDLLILNHPGERE